jgi:hypothetical protein
MDVALNIASSRSTVRKKRNSFVVLIALSLLVGTFLRVSLLVIYPIITLFILAFYRFRITSSFILLLGVSMVSLLLSFFENFFLKYKVLSLFYMLPFLLLLFSDPSTEKNGKVNQLSVFITSLTLVAMVNDIIGLIQVIVYPNSDDSFVGIYSQYSLSINGLMLLNSILFFYYFISFIAYKKLIYLLPSAFFLCCSFLGYYGAGLVIFLVALILAFFKLRAVAIIRTVATGVIALVLAYMFMAVVKPLALEYNIANIKKLVSFDPVHGARKVTSFYNYGISYPRNVRDFLFGSGPGTFNSRSAFMVGSPDYFQHMRIIKDDRQPYYFKNYAYTLWNAGNTQKELYLDGFRNQPFSSVLAFLGEYGLIFTLAFFYLYYRYYRKVAFLYRSQQRTGESLSYFRFFKFLIILLPLLLLIDNYFEYPEIMLLVIVGIKFAHAGIEQQKQTYA